MRKCKPFDLAAILESFSYDPQIGVVTRSDGETGYKNDIGYVQIYFNGRIYSAHRLAWALAHKVQPVGEIDHINGNRADNRLCNLRLVSSQEQNRNRSLSKRNKSGVKGVCWEAARGKWRATVNPGGKVVLVGRFDNLNLAKEAVMATRKRLHGDFANHG